MSDDERYEEEEELEAPSDEDDYVEFCDAAPDPEVKVMDEKALFSEQQEMVTRISDLLNLTPSAACVVLRHFRWKADELTQRFFEDPDGLMKKLGIHFGTAKPFTTAVGTGSDYLACSVCFDMFPTTKLYGMKCQHWLCRSCWEGFLTAQVNDGPSCTSARCPAHKCPHAVDESLFQEFLDDGSMRKFREFVTRSFVEDNPNVAWCPAPGCNRAVWCTDTSKLCVACTCGHKFCFVCSEEAHAPVKCDLLRKWKEKEKGESENSKWLYANTKPCPKCHSHIQKNDGCNHMTCSKCRYEFCWICVGEWAKHGTSWYNCNFYDKKDTQNTEESKGEVRRELERYLFYYERYYEHAKSAKHNAETDLPKMRALVTEVQSRHGDFSGEFLINAVQQLIDNRSMLKYTFVYAYYLERAAKAKELFEYSQADLEKTTEKLNSLVAELLTRSRDALVERQHVMDLVGLAKSKLDKLIQGVYSEEDERARAEVVEAFHAAHEKSRPANSHATGSLAHRPALPPNPQESVQKLIAMGFSRERAVAALHSTSGNAEEAIVLLLAM